MVSGAYVPHRGDVVWLDFNPQAGREQAGRRPALVLSPTAYNGRALLAIVCPISTKTKGYPFEMPIPRGHPVKGTVLTDHLRSIDWSKRKIEYWCDLPDDFLDLVSRRICKLIS